MRPEEVCPTEHESRSLLSFKRAVGYFSISQLLVALAHQAERSMFLKRNPAFLNQKSYRIVFQCSLTFFYIHINPNSFFPTSHLVNLSIDVKTFKLMITKRTILPIVKILNILYDNFLRISHGTWKAWVIFNTGINNLKTFCWKSSGILVEGFGWELKLAHWDGVNSVERDPDDLLTQQVEEVVLAHQQWPAHTTKTC